MTTQTQILIVALFSLVAIGIISVALVWRLHRSEGRMNRAAKPPGASPRMSGIIPRIEAKLIPGAVAELQVTFRNDSPWTTEVDFTTDQVLWSTPPSTPAALPVPQPSRHPLGAGATWTIRVPLAGAASALKVGDEVLYSLVDRGSAARTKTLVT